MGMGRSSASSAPQHSLVVSSRLPTFTVRLVNQSCSPPLPSKAPPLPPRQSHHTPILTTALLNPLWYPFVPSPPGKVPTLPTLYCTSCSALSPLSLVLRLPVALLSLSASAFFFFATSSSSLVLPYPPDHFRGVSTPYLLASLPLLSPLPP